MQFTGEVTSVVVEINMIGLYQTMIGRLRQLSEPRLRQQAGIEKSQTPVERNILVQWVRISSLCRNAEGMRSLPSFRHYPLTRGLGFLGLHRRPIDYFSFLL